MDHATAHLMAMDDTIVTEIITSHFTQQQKSASLEKNENLMHNKEQHQQSSFYKKLADAISKYDEVVLFGPTSAKSELFNILQEDHHFAKIRIEVKSSDNLTENQQHAFVKDYFQAKQN